jgi:hypothetical protein
MSYELSIHVQQEMQRRGISQAVAEAVLTSPDQKVPNTVMWHASVEDRVRSKAISGAGNGERDGDADKGCNRVSNQQDREVLEIR